MSVIRFGRGRDYQIFRQEEVRRRWDLRSAVQFLNRFRTDSVAMESFRREVARQITVAPASLSNEHIIQSLARMLVAGEFMVVMPERLQLREPLSLATPAPAPPAPRASAPAEVVEDEPTFASGHDGVMQAAVLLAAAREGVPFCEECAKRAAGERGNTPPAAKQTASPAPATESKESTPAGAPSSTPPSTPPSAPPAPPPSAHSSAPASTLTQASDTPEAKDADNTPAVEQKTYWVEIALVGEDGKPIPDEEFIVVLPDGKRMTGQLDGKGSVRFDGLLTSGTCKVSFPQIDKDAWQMAPAQSGPGAGA